MIECKECQDYAKMICERGEIPADEIPKVALDRHILKGCDKKQCPFLEWIEFEIENQQQIYRENPFPMPQWNKGYWEALIDCKERYLATINSKSIEL